MVKYYRNGAFSGWNTISAGNSSPLQKFHSPLGSHRVTPRLKVTPVPHLRTPATSRCFGISEEPQQGADLLLCTPNLYAHEGLGQEFAFLSSKEGKGAQLSRHLYNTICFQRLIRPEADPIGTPLSQPSGVQFNAVQAKGVQFKGLHHTQPRAPQPPGAGPSAPPPFHGRPGQALRHSP